VQQTLTGTIITNNLVTPYNIQTSAGVQRELPGNVALSVAYVGSRSRNLTFNSANININQVEPAYYSQGSALANPADSRYRWRRPYRLR